MTSLYNDCVFALDRNGKSLVQIHLDDDTVTHIFWHFCDQHGFENLRRDKPLCISNNNDHWEKMPRAVLDAAGWSNLKVVHMRVFELLDRQSEPQLPVSPGVSPEEPPYVYAFVSTPCGQKTVRHAVNDEVIVKGIAVLYANKFLDRLVKAKPEVDGDPTYIWVKLPKSVMRKMPAPPDTGFMSAGYIRMYEVLWRMVGPEGF